MRRVPGFVAGLLVLLLLVWHLALPESTVKGLLNKSLSGTGLSVEMTGFSKGFFGSISAETLTLAGTGGGPPAGTVLTLQGVSAGLVPGSLLSLEPRLFLRGRLAEGSLSATIRLAGDRSATVSAESVNIRDLTVLRSYGIEGEGLLKGDLIVTGGLGRATFSISDAKLQNTTLGGALLPLSPFHTIRGAFEIRPGKTEMPSVALEGKGVYARVSGTIQGRAMNLKVEVMHDASHTPDPMVAAMLRPNRISPGYYVIPVSQALP